MIVGLLTVVAVLCSVVIVRAIQREPGILLRPSFFVTLLVHLRLQWPSVASHETVEYWLTTPMDYWLIIHGFVVLNLAFIDATGRAGLTSPTRNLWTAVVRPVSLQAPEHRRHLPWILVFTLLITSYYLTVVPFSSTGLYALITNPTGLGEARQASLANISGPVAYLVTWQINTFAPLLVAVAAVLFMAKRRGVGLLLLGVGMMAITGSRSGVAFAVIVLFVIYGAANWGRWSRLIPAAFIGFILVVGSTTLITLTREGRDVNRESAASYSENVGLGRIFNTPLKTSVFYFDFAEQHGHLGVSTIRPLATYYERPFIPLARVIGRTYVEPNSPSIVTNTNFLAVYYVGYGFWTLPISMLGLLLFDLLLIPLARARRLALPLVGVLVVKGMYLSEGVLHTSLINGGYVLLPLVAWWSSAVVLKATKDPTRVARPLLHRGKPVDTRGLRASRASGP